MLFLPAAALCCLCSALVVMAADLIQDDLTLTKRVGQSVSFSCEITKQFKDDYVYWYQKKEKEFRIILDLKKSSGAIDKRYGHPQKDDFTAEKTQTGCELKINKVTMDHSASYFCSCYKDVLGGSGYYIFGSGTRLLVTGQPVVKPVVSVYPAASRVHVEGSSSLLCLASAMFPPVVQFSWKRQKNNGPLEDLTSTGEEQLELSESGRITSILLVQQQKDSSYKYSCFVKHEGGTVEAQTQQELPPLPAAVSTAAPKAPTSRPATVNILTTGTASVPPLDLVKLSFQSECRVKLLCLLYSVLIVKSLVYCCGLSLLMILRNKGASTNSRHAE